MSSIPETPFRNGAWALQRSDWGDPVVIAAGTKQPLLRGYTGGEGVSPTDEEVNDWTTRHATSFLGLRPDADVVGFDLDHHSGKTGADTWARFCDTHGEQDPTFSVTARGQDSASRTLLFRLPGDVSTKRWKDSTLAIFGDGIDLIRRWHRTQVFPPSPHHTGALYALYGPGGEVVTGDTLPPKDDALALLSDEAVMHMERECVCFYVSPEVLEERETLKAQIKTMPRSGLRKGALTILERHAQKLAGLAPDTERNNTLNSSTYALMMQLVLGEGTLQVSEVIELMEMAASEAGLGSNEIDRTIRSAVGDALDDFEGVTA